MTVLVSCGKQDFPNYDEEEVVLEHQEAEASFKADFRSLNGLQNRIKANGLLWVKGRQIYIKIVMNKSFPFLRYQQFIHAGSRCPGRSDDLNGDRIIDAYEVRRASGDILIPLDKNIQIQTKGMEWFPVSDKEGEYYYSRATALPFLMDDLYQKDQFPADGITKLAVGENLDLDRRTVIIYGTPSDPLKPVACAEIQYD